MVVSEWLAVYAAVPMIWLFVMGVEDRAHRGIAKWMLGSFVVLGFFPFLLALQFSWMFVAVPIAAAVISGAVYLGGGFGEADVLVLVGLAFWMPIWQIFALALVLSIGVHGVLLRAKKEIMYPYFPSLFISYVIAYIIGFIFIF